MTDREFWIIVRACLIQMVKAIERKYQLGEHKTDEIARDM